MRKPYFVARPQIVSDRVSLNVYLGKKQKEALLKEAHRLKITPSALIRSLIDEELIKRACPG